MQKELEIIKICKYTIFDMGGNYEKIVYDQLMEVMARFDIVESDSKQAHKELKTLNNEVHSLQSENTKLRKKDRYFVLL